MKSYLFVGERPSPKAKAMRVKWADGRLAAKQLFDALAAIGIDPTSHQFDNVFRSDLSEPETVCRRAIGRIRRIASQGATVVAMGKKAQAVLIANDIGHIPIVHPAARGSIRKKCRYESHIREALRA